MQRKLLLCGLILACSFVLISPFGGSLNLAALTESVEVTTLASNPSVRLGASVASCDFNNDGKKDTFIGAPEDNSGSGVVIVLFGGSTYSTVDMTDPAASGSGFLITYSGATGFGNKIACVGDVNNDGFEDIGILDYFGVSFPIVYGSDSINSDIEISSLSYPAVSILDRSGTPFIVDIVGIGDTTGDQTDDFVIVLQNALKYSAVVFYGSLGSTAISDIATPGLSFVVSNGASQSAYISVASAGLFDGDSLYDFAVGNLNSGAQVAIIFGNSAGYSNIDLASGAYSLLSTQKVLFVNADSSFTLGNSMAYAGDINGDGRGDLLIGGPSSYSSYGAAFIIFGSASFSADIAISYIQAGSGQGRVITHGTVSGKQGGFTVFGCLPSDTLASCPTIAVCDYSTTCIMLFSANIGSGSTLFDIDTMKSQDGFPVYNSLVPYTYPMQIAMMGDANADGYPDYLIGQAQAYSDTGRAYIVFGLNKCTSPCKTCAGLPSADWTKCTSCESGLGTDFVYNYGCVGSCPSHSYQNSSTSCEDCNSRCLECSTTADSCDTCDNGGSYPLLYNNDCYGTCPSGTYQDSGTTCADCDGNCLDCSGTDTHCTSCDTGGAVPWLYNNECVASCASHTFEDSATTCADCDGNCLECSGTDTNCISCDTGGSLPWLYNTACYGSCPSHSFQDSSTTCATCNSKCLECNTAANICSSCDNSGSYPWLYNSFCYGTCPSHTFEDSATTCADCDGNCLECSGTNTNCVSCDTSGLLPFFYSSVCYSSCPPAAPYLYSFVCYIQCPAGTAADSQKVCIIVLPVNILAEESQAVKSLSTIDDIRQISNEIMSLISSLFFGGLHPIRSQSVQGPVSYYIFLNVDYPVNYGQYGSSNFGSSNLPNPFKDTGETKTSDDGVKSANKYLENQSLLANVGYSICLLLLCLLLIPLNDYVLAKIEKHKKDYESKRYYKLLKRGSVLFRWSFLINQFISKYQDLAFFSFLGIYNAGVGEKDTLNLVVCIIGFLITVAGLLGAFFKIKRLTKKLEGFSEKEKEKEEYTQNDFLGRRLVLYKDLKKDKFMPMLYPFFLMARVFGFCFVTIFLCNQTAIQLTFLNLYAILMFIYLAKYRPLEEKDQLWLTFAFEIDAFIALFGVTILAIYNTAGGTNENTRTGFGYLIIASNTGMLVLNFISFFMEVKEYLILGFKTLKHLYQKSKNKKKVTPEQIPSKDTSFMPPTGKEFNPYTVIEGTPSVMPEGIYNFHIDSPELASPNNMSEVILPPISSCIENGSINERLSLLRIENSMDLRRSSARKRSAQDRQSINLPVTEIPESEI